MNIIHCNDYLIRISMIVFPFTNLILLYLFSYHFTLSKFEDDNMTFILFYTLMDSSLQFLIEYHYIFVLLMVLNGLFITNTIHNYMISEHWLEIYFFVYLVFCTYKYSFLKYKNIKKIK